MQQLQNASDIQSCARGVLETVLAVMVSVRESAARRQRQTTGQDGCSLIHVRAMGVIRKRPGATLSMVADQLVLTLSATSRLVDCLVARRLVRREVPEGNRRTVALHLTKAGAKTLERAIKDAQVDLARTLEKMPAAKRGKLCAAMEGLRELFDEQ